MNIGDLTKGVAEATGSTDADAKKAITAVFDQIANAAAKGSSRASCEGWANAELDALCEILVAFSGTTHLITESYSGFTALHNHSENCQASSFSIS